MSSARSSSVAAVVLAVIAAISCAAPVTTDPSSLPAMTPGPAATPAATSTGRTSTPPVTSTAGPAPSSLDDLVERTCEADLASSPPGAADPSTVDDWRGACRETMLVGLETLGVDPSQVGSVAWGVVGEPASSPDPCTVAAVVYVHAGLDGYPVPRRVAVTPGDQCLGRPAAIGAPPTQSGPSISETIVFSWPPGNTIEPSRGWRLLRDLDGGEPFAIRLGRDHTEIPAVWRTVTGGEGVPPIDPIGEILVAYQIQLSGSCDDIAFEGIEINNERTVASGRFAITQSAPTCPANPRTETFLVAVDRWLFPDAVITFRLQEATVTCDGCDPNLQTAKLDLSRGYRLVCRVDHDECQTRADGVERIVERDGRKLAELSSVNIGYWCSYDAVFLDGRGFGADC